MFMLQYLLELVGSKIFLTGYVTGNSTFPKPLNEKEEKIYLERLKDGDVEAKRVLVERNLRLVAHIVKKYSSNYQNSKEMDDLISIGTIGLIKAIDSFDTNKGIRLATYAAKCIDNEILMFFRNTKKTKGEVFLQDPIGVDKSGNEIFNKQLEFYMGKEMEKSMKKYIQHRIDKDEFEIDDTDLFTKFFIGGQMAVMNCNKKDIDEKIEFLRGILNKFKK